MASATLIKALAITAQLFGRDFTPEAAQVLAEDLSSYPDAPVLAALSRCRRELRTFPTLSDIIARVDDGRPGFEEAWAMIPKDESQSVVWTEEMAGAFDVARRLIDDDRIAARMAFKETYIEMTARARASQAPVRWTPSLGFDRSGRQSALTEAVAKGRITIEHARELVPELEHRSAGKPELGFDVGKLLPAMPGAE